MKLGRFDSEKRVPIRLPIPALRRSGTVRLTLACLVFALAPAAAEAFTTRTPQRPGVWRGHQVQQTKPMVKRTPVKAQAAKPSKPAKPEATAPAKPAEHAGNWTTGEAGGRACFRSRRKLWQANEGWVVKKVNVCP